MAGVTLGWAEEANEANGLAFSRRAYLQKAWEHSYRGNLTWGSHFTEDLHLQLNSLKRYFDNMCVRPVKRPKGSLFTSSLYPLCRQSQTWRCDKRRYVAPYRVQGNIQAIMNVSIALNSWINEASNDLMCPSLMTNGRDDLMVIVGRIIMYSRQVSSKASKLWTV